MQDGRRPQQQEIDREKIEQIDRPQERGARRAPVAKARRLCPPAAEARREKPSIPADRAGAPAKGEAAQRRRRRRSPANRKRRSAGPTANPASAKPIGIPSDVKRTNRPFAIAGAKSAASAIASGMPPPRPRPVRNLAIASCVGDSTNAETSERMPNADTQTIMTGLRPSRSPSRPAISEPSKRPILPAASADVNVAGGTREASTSGGTTYPTAAMS